MKVTLGGDRLGSGKKVKQDLHNYFRSTHDLSQTWTSPMTVGALYPFLVIPCMRNDKFSISLNADTVTVPTKGPLFGSFKMQTDLFFCPVRLYQAILHNNPTNIGLKMNQVMLPDFELSCDTTNLPNHIAPMLNNSCLWKYLGLSGLGKGGIKESDTYTLKRKFNAVPLLAYYDIFKNYYSNKQEEKAYVIQSKEIEKVVRLIEIDINNGNKSVQFDGSDYDFYIFPNSTATFEIKGEYLNKIVQNGNDIFELRNFEYTLSVYFTTTELKKLLLGQNVNLRDDTLSVDFSLIEYKENSVKIAVTPNSAIYSIYASGTDAPTYLTLDTFEENEPISLSSFDLKNIDDMRMAILSHHTLGSAFSVNGQQYLPYNTNVFSASLQPLNGLVVKTYQSDIYNNWVNTEWIDGENGIAEITKIATSDGAFKLDQLNLAEKLYNMLNRVAVSGGTYEDWQDAVYDEAPHKHIESPIYLGGMSSEIVFEQIVANTAAQTDSGEQPLGDLAGRGRYIKRKGGHVSCKCDEAGYIIGIVSITPRIKYTQGNEFYLTDIKSLDDMHKPALDGIGFQNLIGERLAAFDTTQANDGTISRSVVGKLPAWMEYMTAVDKTYGDFAELDGKAFMSLNRNYEMDGTGDIADLTTYIDPTKYNYAFAYTALDAQNFWTEIHSKITARRKMSAKQIPNL